MSRALINFLLTLEARRNRLLASTDNQAKCNRHIQVNSKHIGLNGSAKTQCSFKVSQPVKQCATLARGRGSERNVNESEKVGANSQLQRVLRARRWRRSGLRIACATSGRDRQVAKERDDQNGGRKLVGSHGWQARVVVYQFKGLGCLTWGEGGSFLKEIVRWVLGV